MWSLIFAGSEQQITHPPIINFTTDAYNADPQNWDIGQDNRGLVYFANNDGLLQFDGTHWNRFPITNIYGTSLDVDAADKVFIGGYGEFGFLAIDSLGIPYYSSLSNRLPDSLQGFNDVWQTTIYRDQVIFDATDHLFIYRDDSLYTLRPRSIFFRHYEVGDELWVLDHEVGLFRLDGLELSYIEGSDFYAGHDVLSVLPMDQNRVLVLTKSDGMFLFTEGKNGKNEPFASGLTGMLNKAQPYGAIRLKNEEYAINTLQMGVFIISPEGNLKYHFSSKDGMQSDIVFKVFQDRYGQLWCALNNGITHITYNQPIFFARKNYGFSGSIKSFIRYKDAYYMATSKGVFRLLTNPKQGEQQSIQRGGFERIKNIASLCWDLKITAGDLFVAAGNAGIYRIDGLREKLLSGISVTNVYASPLDSSVLLGGGRGGIVVLRKEQGRWREKIHIDNLPDDVISIARENNGKTDSCYYWVGLWSSGLLRIAFDQDYNSYSIQKFDAAYGFGEAEVNIFRLKDKLVFGTDDGFFYYDEKQYRFFKDSIIEKAFGEEKDFAFRIYNTGSDSIWVSGVTKLYHFFPHSERGYIIDSLPFLVMDIGPINAVYPDDQDIFWIAGTDGLACYDRKVDKTFLQDYPALVRKVLISPDSLIFGGTYQTDGRIRATQPESVQPEIAYKHNSIQFNFSAAYFEHPDHLRFAYLLEGFSKDWSPWTKDRKAVFTNLNEGQYTFKVKAKNVYRHESEISSYAFTVLPPWYRTWWAYGSYLLLGAGAFGLGIKLNGQRLLREKQKLETIVADRTAEVVAQKEEIEAKSRDLARSNEELTHQKFITDKQNRDITSSIRYAQRIQEALLPTVNELKSVVKDAFVLYKPKDIVSGDFLWFSAKGEHILIAAADCTGHGVPGAFMSMIGNALLNEIVNEKGIIRPANVLERLREGIIQSLKQSPERGAAKDGMDIALCKIDPQSMELEFAGAYNPLYLVRNDQLLETKGDKQPIGIHILKSNKPFTNHKIKLEPGDRCYLFSDGYVDQFGGPHNRKFTYNRFRDLLLEIRDRSLADQKDYLDRKITEWMSDHPQIDDILVIGFEC